MTDSTELYVLSHTRDCHSIGIGIGIDVEARSPGRHQWYWSRLVVLLSPGHTLADVVLSIMMKEVQELAKRKSFEPS